MSRTDKRDIFKVTNGVGVEGTPTSRLLKTNSYICILQHGMSGVSAGCYGRLLLPDVCGREMVALGREVCQQRVQGSPLQMERLQLQQQHSRLHVRMYADSEAIIPQERQLDLSPLTRWIETVLIQKETAPP